MFGGSVRSAAVVWVVAAVLLTPGTAGAQSAETSEELRSHASDLEADLQRQEAALEREVGELTEVGSELEEAQARADAAASRVEELERQTRGLGRDIEAQERAVAESRSRFEERLAASYKGQKLDGVVLLLEGLFGGNPDPTLADQAVRILVEDQQSIRHHRENQWLLGNTVRQLDQRETRYEELREEQRARAEELERREAQLRASIDELRGKKGRTQGRLEDLERRIAELEAQEAAGLLDPPASGGGEESREEELRIAREEIVVEPVEELPLSGYRQLYKEAAEDYGFGPDWYVLMAVGKVESNHGENLGPSSAGAMGPMQFLPSTWETAGVDGDGDGAANIMDPEDAIPAAAKYLVDGGAPGDWYAALFAYNHAGWYVQEVLEVAEQYRLLAGDNTVGPYGIALGAALAPSYAEETIQEAPAETTPAAAPSRPEVTEPTTVRAPSPPERRTRRRRRNAPLRAPRTGRPRRTSTERPLRGGHPATAPQRVSGTLHDPPISAREQEHPTRRWLRVENALKTRLFVHLARRTRADFCLA